MDTNGHESDGRRRRRIIFGSVAGLAVVGAMAVLFAGRSSNLNVFDRIRQGFDETRRAFDQRRRAWEQERRAAEQVQSEAQAAGQAAVPNRPGAAATTNQ